MTNSFSPQGYDPIQHALAVRIEYSYPRAGVLLDMPLVLLGDQEDTHQAIFIREEDIIEQGLPARLDLPLLERITANGGRIHYGYYLRAHRDGDGHDSDYFVNVPEWS